MSYPDYYGINYPNLNTNPAPMTPIYVPASSPSNEDVRIVDLEKRCNKLEFQVNELKRMIGDIMMSLPKKKK